MSIGEKMSNEEIARDGGEELRPRRGRSSPRRAVAVLLFTIASVAVTSRMAVAKDEATPAGASSPSSSLPSSPPSSAARELWDAHVRELLDTRCGRCHGAAVHKSRLEITSPATILVGGKRGPAIVAGDPDASLLVRVLSPEADPHMPPEGEPLSEEEVALVREWIVRFEPGVASEKSSDASAGAAEADPRASVVSRYPAPPGRVRPRLVIDLLVEGSYAERGVEPAPLASDETFLRRVYLDLAGRVPRPDERERFLADPRSEKRELLSDELLGSDEWPRRMREVFDVVFLGRERPRRRDRNEAERERWHEFLEAAFRENRPWDRIVTEVISGRPAGAESRGADWFLFSHRNDHQAIAESLGPAVLGLRVQCAQCHNHPIAPEIEQRHYWGLVAFFSRSKNVSTPDGPAVAESAIGGWAQYSDLKGQNHPARPVFLDDRAPQEVWPKDGEKVDDDASLYTVAPAAEGEGERASVPIYSRRAELAKLVTSSERLDRALVNRVWALLLGRGIVHPVDTIDSAHPASHPVLLDWLAEDFGKSGRNVRRLAREIVASRVYQLDSRWPENRPKPTPDSFAYGLEKPLTAEALARSLLVALGGGAKDTQLDESSLREVESACVEVFPVVFPEVYSPTLREALFLSNGSVIDRLVAPSSGNLAARLLEIRDAAERVRMAFAVCLGRDPDGEELRFATEYLDVRKDRPEDGVAQLLWSLVTSAEFQLNH